MAIQKLRKGLPQRKSAGTFIEPRSDSASNDEQKMPQPTRRRRMREKEVNENVNYNDVEDNNVNNKMFPMISVVIILAPNVRN